MRDTAAGLYCVSKQHKLGVTVLTALLIENSLPRALGIIEHKRDESHLRFLACVIYRAGLCWSSAHGSASEQRKEVAVEHEAEYEHNQKAANPKVWKSQSANTETAGISTAIFQVRASALV